MNDSIIGIIADLPANERDAAIDRVLALLDKPALGAFEPHRSRRYSDVLRRRLQREVYDLVHARLVVVEPEAAA
jgi:hypothetical protein